MDREEKMINKCVLLVSNAVTLRLESRKTLLAVKTQN